MNRHDQLIEELLLRWDRHFERLLSILEKRMAVGEIEKSPFELQPQKVTKEDLDRMKGLSEREFSAFLNSVVSTDAISDHDGDDL